MLQFKYRFVTALLTFTIGILLAFAVAAVSNVWRIVEVEQPPCGSCAGLYTPEVPLVSICDLKSHLDHYRGKIVRARAVFYHDAGQVNLGDDACPKVRLHAGLSDSCQSCVGARKGLTIYSGFGTWYDSAARVGILGRIGRLENPTLFADDNGFNIDCLESAEPLGSGREERIKYTQGELIQILFH